MWWHEKWGKWSSTFEKEESGGGPSGVYLVNEETGYTSSSSSDTVDINTVLAGPSGVNPDNEIYVCDEPKCEPFHQEEETHQVVQQSQKKHECADCGQSFETTTILKKDMKCHAPINPLILI